LTHTGEVSTEWSG